MTLSMIADEKIVLVFAVAVAVAVRCIGEGGKQCFVFVLTKKARLSEMNLTCIRFASEFQTF